METTATKPDIEGLKLVVEAVRQSDNGNLYMAAWEDVPQADGCGFAGCAIGWHCHVNSDDALQLVGGIPILSTPLGNLHGFNAVAARFGIGPMEADYLFGEWSYRDDNGNVNASRSAVIARIEQFIREHEGT